MRNERNWRQLILNEAIGEKINDFGSRIKNKSFPVSSFSEMNTVEEGGEKENWWQQKTNWS